MRMPGMNCRKAIWMRWRKKFWIFLKRISKRSFCETENIWCNCSWRRRSRSDGCDSCCIRRRTYGNPGSSWSIRKKDPGNRKWKMQFYESDAGGELLSMRYPCLCIAYIRTVFCRGYDCIFPRAGCDDQRQTGILLSEKRPGKCHSKCIVAESRKAWNWDT